MLGDQLKIPKSLTPVLTSRTLGLVRPFKHFIRQLTVESL